MPPTWTDGSALSVTPVTETTGIFTGLRQRKCLLNQRRRFRSESRLVVSAGTSLRRLLIAATRSYARLSMVPRERVKRERRASRLDFIVRGQVGGCSRNY